MKKPSPGPPFNLNDPTLRLHRPTPALQARDSRFAESHKDATPHATVSVISRLQASAGGVDLWASWSEEQGGDCKKNEILSLDRRTPAAIPSRSFN
jgi:hypothetical protein